MRQDEAMFRLATLSKTGFDIKDYVEAMRVLIKSYDDTMINPEEVSAILYFSERMNPHIRVIMCEDILNEYANVLGIVRYPYSNLFSDCFGLSYEHWNGPDITPVYDRPLEYYDFDSLIQDVLKKESNEYFLTTKDYFMLPAYETKENFVWQMYVKEPYEKYYVGRVTIPKITKS